MATLHVGYKQMIMAGIVCLCEPYHFVHTVCPLCRHFVQNFENEIVVSSWWSFGCFQQGVISAGYPIGRQLGICFTPDVLPEATPLLFQPWDRYSIQWLWFGHKNLIIVSVVYKPWLWQFFNLSYIPQVHKDLWAQDKGLGDIFSTH